MSLNPGDQESKTVTPAEAEAELWHSVYQGYEGDSDAFWDFLLRPRPIERVDDLLIDEIEQRWIATTEGESGVSLGRVMATDLFDPHRPADLAMLRRIVMERDLLTLLSADWLWSQLEGTNRKYWRDTIETWTTELEASQYLAEARIANKTASSPPPADSTFDEDEAIDALLEVEQRDFEAESGQHRQRAGVNKDIQELVDLLEHMADLSDLENEQE